MLSENSDTWLRTLSHQPVVIPPSEGEMLRGDGLTCQFKVTTHVLESHLGIYEIVLQPHTMGAAQHFHEVTDEIFIVLKGTITLQSAYKIYYADEGAVIQVPRLTPHGFCNDSNGEARVLLIFSTGSEREDYFRALFQAIQNKTLQSQAFKDIGLRHDTFSINY
jgi:quercetin dioxygenase-like cupin family protein